MKDTIISYAIFIVIYVIMFYLSLKKCFLREGKSRSGLVVRAIFTNPITLYTVSQIVVVILGTLIGVFSGLDEATILSELTSVSLLSVSMTTIGAVLLVLLSIRCSLSVGKWLEAPNVSLVTFVYIIFTVICGLLSLPYSRNGTDTSAAYAYTDYISVAVFTVFELLFYHFVIKELARLTDRKRHISWQLFLIPPILFLSVYYVFDYITEMRNDGFSDIIVLVYSLMILMLFLWAFYIVIKNINATNAAIEAKYESEHDKLTGLYNKGKYINMKEDNFGNPHSIAIYNFDVNNLKYINDNFGHELGDELIIKAAQSIHAVVSDNIYGFRMGGDEYVMVGVNITRDEAENVRQKWQQALGKVNEEGKVYCVMACGLKYGEGEFDYDELYHQADEQMYVDKKARKEKGETSHLRDNPAGLTYNDRQI